MEAYIFLITLFVVLISNSIQTYKIYIKKTSQGISFDAYYLTLIAVSIMAISTNDLSIRVIAITEFIMTVITLYFLFYYNDGYVFKLTKTFFVSLFFSFIMIFGVAQSITSYKNKGKSNVSISAYLLWGFLNCLLLYQSNDWYIQTSLTITNILYLYIIFKSFTSNRN